jgi:DNA end-binding protein Ku
VTLYVAKPRDISNAKRKGKTIGPKPRPRGENVVDLMEALKKSLASEATPHGKRPREASAGQKEMLLPIEEKRGAERRRRPAVNKAQGRIAQVNGQ